MKSPAPPRHWDEATGGVNDEGPADHEDIKVKVDAAELEGSSTFEKKTCFGETCSSLRFTLNWAGALLAMTSAGLDIAYAARSPFYAKVLYILAVLF